MVFTSKHNMEMTKSEKLLKKNENKISGIFFDMISSKKGRGWGLSWHLCSTLFLVQLSNSQKIRLWKFQVNLVSSFGDI